MKNQSVAMQFSGYPLAVAEEPRETRPRLMVVPKPVNEPTTSIQKNKISNDPKSWDESWFNGYE